MTSKPDDDKGFAVQPFDPDKHDRTEFSCGVERIDNYLKLSAKKHQKGDFARVYVAVRSGEAKVAAYYVLNAHAALGPDLPQNLVRGAPSHGQIAGAYLSIIGVDRSEQGRGLGETLMIEAFKNVAQAASLIGIKFLMLDVLDDNDPEAMQRRASFYSKLGFTSLHSRPFRMFISTATIRMALNPD